MQLQTWIELWRQPIHQKDEKMTKRWRKMKRWKRWKGDKRMKHHIGTSKPIILRDEKMKRCQKYEKMRKHERMENGWSLWRDPEEYHCTTMVLLWCDWYVYAPISSCHWCHNLTMSFNSGTRRWDSNPKWRLASHPKWWDWHLQLWPYHTRDPWFLQQGAFLWVLGSYQQQRKQQACRHLKNILAK